MEAYLPKSSTAKAKDSKPRRSAGTAKLGATKIKKTVENAVAKNTSRTVGLKGESTKSHSKAITAKSRSSRLFKSPVSFLDKSASDLIAKTRQGMPADVVIDMARILGMTQDKFFDSVGLPKSTMKDRLSKKTPLSKAESDRMYRVDRVRKRAVAVLEDQQAANQWMQRNNRSLGGETPLALLDTEAGYELVIDTLGRIEYGVVA